MEVNNCTETKLDLLLDRLESGSRPKGGVKGISEGIPSIGAEHLDSDGSFNLCKVRYIPSIYAKTMRRGLIKKQDILIVKDGATTGKVSYVSDEYPFDVSYVNEHVFICRVNANVLSKYVYYYLRSFQGNAQIMSTFHGGAQGGINSGFVDEVFIPLLPVNQQQQIVDNLDDLVPRVKAIRSRLEKLPILIKKFRQSILSAACSGVLTDEYSNYDDERWAKVINSLQDDVLDSGFTMPSHWVCVPLKSIANGFQYGTSSKSDISGLIPVIRMGNLQNGIIDWNGLKYTSELSEINKYALEAGDVLFNRTNSPDLVGKTSIYESDRNAIFAGYLIRIKNKKDILLSEYLNYFLNSQYGREWCKQVRTDGVGQSNISASMLATSPIPLPPIEEQREIVNIVQQLFILADSLEVRYKKAMLRIEKIEQAILAKAFSG